MIEAFGDQIWSADEILVMVIVDQDGNVVVQGDSNVEPWEVASYLRQIADDFERDGWDYGEEVGSDDDERA